MASEPLRRILLVEDDVDIQTIARFALEQVGGFTVEVCSSGAEAIERGPAFAPQIILLDVMMPDLDGPSTLAELRRLPATAETPVAFMTAKVQPQELARYKELGAVDVISKPFDPMALSDTVRAVWDKASGGEA
jgi:CheY-like chemotaxis protein